MKDNKSKFTAVELTKIEAESINGGGFAYDAGFFLRALFVSGGNGVLMANEFAMNYRPAN